MKKLTCHYCGEKHNNYSNAKPHIDEVGLCDNCRQKLEEKYNEFDRMSNEDIFNYFNNKFKNMESFDEWKELLLYLNRLSNVPYMEIRNKRTGKEAYHFTQNPYNSERMDYLYNDGVSTGSCEVKDASRYLKLKIWQSSL